MKILVLNCRIYSVEYEIFEMPEEKELCRGVVEKIGLETSILTHQPTGKEVEKTVVPIIDHQRAIELILQTIVHSDYGVIGARSEIDAVGHRIVHGGEKFISSVLIDEKVKQGIYENFELAPLHNPYNFKGIEAVEKLLPNLPQVAVFDTSFYTTLPDKVYRYAVPERLYQEYRIRKYGFHGISHRYVAEHTASILKKPLNKLNIISCHLGAGASITAIKGGVAVDTSMGFTPLEGLMMTTRSGDLDPGIIFYLQKSGWTLNAVESCLNRESGILGVSGISDNMKEVIASSLEGDSRAKLAVEMFVYRVRKYIGAYWLELGDIEAITFTGGIGENAPLIREKICAGLDSIGIKIDDAKNKKAVDYSEAVISGRNSKTKLIVIPGNEKLLIARDAVAVLKKSKVCEA